MSQSAVKEAAELLVRFFNDTDEFAVDGAERTWEGPLGFEGLATSDNRYLIPGEIGQRDLPLPLNVQLQTGEGHDDSVNAGRIESIKRIPLAKFDRAAEFNLEGLPAETVVIFGSGILDGSPAAQEAARLIENGAGVSLDITRERLALLDPKTHQEVPEDEVDLAKALEGGYLQGIGGKIGGATIVTISAFEQSAITLVEDGALVASAVTLRLGPPAKTLVASAAPLKPSSDWFRDPQLKRLTPMTYTDDGRVFGHLCDWSGCHTGFSNICVPPFRSTTDFAYFNVGEIECDDGELLPCGKLMFSMDGEKHYDPTDRSYQNASKHYDDATKVGAYVRAGTDQFGVWLAGCLRPSLSEEEVQFLRLHPPSGDWRPIPGKGSELIAAFSVPVPGFPIARALVASGETGGLTVITAPLVVEPMGPREIRRRMEVLRARREALFSFGAEREWAFEPESEDFASITAEQRRRWAKSGVARPDGSFPITKCSGEGTSAVNARRAVGRANPGDREAVRRHIARREKALGCSSD